MIGEVDPGSIVYAGCGLPRLADIMRINIVSTNFFHDISMFLAKIRGKMQIFSDCCPDTVYCKAE